MVKGSKYYSINGKLTKRGKQEAIKDLEDEITAYENAKKVICELPLTQCDFQIIVDTLDRYIGEKQAKINAYLQ